MKTLTIFFLLALLLVSCSLSTETRPDPKTSTKGKPINQNNKASGNDGGVFGSGSGLGIPGFDYGWGNVGGGYGGGFGGPKGGSSKGGVIKPSVVCKEKGPCYKKKLTCPAKCFTSYSRSGKGYGGGGGGGGCTIDFPERLWFLVYQFEWKAWISARLPKLAKILEVLSICNGVRLFNERHKFLDDFLGMVMASGMPRETFTW
ncbi:hypothetical protein POTOM_040610 [Populus tomentosa]|uniref:Glycine-rich protein n=1 Tax=Populus tomentosa TaxID=118781 RepID=A0A8X7YSC6_POPTO|nr:hypothetical protein POTOM_040610 [Populus tomentosa]